MIGEVDTRFAGIVQKSLFTQSAIIATNHAKRFNGTTFQKSKKTGQYVSSEQMLKRLDESLTKARAKQSIGNR